MKHCSLSFACFALIFCLTVPAFAESKTDLSVETIMLDNFDDPSAVDWNWKVSASSFIDEGYPKYGYVSGMPNSIKQVSTENNDDAKVLGVQVAYKRKGDNWFELFPQKENEEGEVENYEIPLKGSVTQTDFWVWGANYQYYLEVLLRDTDGRIVTLPAGYLDFHGWKNIVIKMPTWLKQRSSLRSGPESITFVGFSIKSDPGEPVDDFTVYFDNFRYTTNPYSNIYDGYELRQTDFDAINENDGENAQ